MSDLRRSGKYFEQHLDGFETRVVELFCAQPPVDPLLTEVALKPQTLQGLTSEVASVVREGKPASLHVISVKGYSGVLLDPNSDRSAAARIDAAAERLRQAASIAAGVAVELCAAPDMIQDVEVFMSGAFLPLQPPHN